MLKFDEGGNAIAKKYLVDAWSTKVRVEGTERDGELAVTDIQAAEKKP